MKQNYKSFGRSKTKRQLPSLGVKTARIPSSNSYLGQVTHQLYDNVQYEKMDVPTIGKEKRKLKQILLRMNDQTYQIISGLTPKPRKAISHHRTATAVLALNQHHAENNFKVIQQCLQQIQTLKERSNLLENHNKQFFIEVIAKTKNSIQQLQEEIKILRQQTQKSGKIMVKQNSFINANDIRQAQMDVYLAEHKFYHLKAQDSRVQAQIKQYEQKIKQIKPKWGFAQKYLKEHQNKCKQKQNFVQNELQLQQKKVKLISVSKKLQFYKQNSQYKYYSLLRELESSTDQLSMIESKIQKFTDYNEDTKVVIAYLQKQLAEIKDKKKQRQWSLNQFLGKQRTKTQSSKQQNNQNKKSREATESENSKVNPQKQQNKEEQKPQLNTINVVNSLNTMDKQLTNTIKYENKVKSKYQARLKKH